VRGNAENTGGGIGAGEVECAAHDRERQPPIGLLLQASALRVRSKAFFWSPPDGRHFHNIEPYYGTGVRAAVRPPDRRRGAR
jgi:hypothetical protein